MTRIDATSGLVLAAFTAFLAIFVGVLCQQRVAERVRLCGQGAPPTVTALATDPGVALAALKLAFAERPYCPAHGTRIARTP